VPRIAHGAHLPDVETIVVNDGSRDATGEIAREYEGVRVIDIPERRPERRAQRRPRVATGEIVAYTDADVRVDPDWLTYLVQPILTGRGRQRRTQRRAADDPWMAQCVARAPGGPTHVLLDDRIAEHVPGCNMAFRREALLAIGGFNPIYLRAGDDVDICWRLQAPAASDRLRAVGARLAPPPRQVSAYWRQQVGYGEGEVWLEHQHPDKFAGGHDAVARPHLQPAAVPALAEMPQATAPEHVTRRPWKAPLPHPADIARTARLAVGRDDRRAFWSEAWVDHGGLLTELIGVMRASRPAPVVDVDEGWRPDRDVSVAVGRWGWLHVKALVEEHAQGRCLVRFSSRLRLSAIGTFQALTVSLALAAGSIALMSLHRPSGRVLSLVALAMLVARTMWQSHTQLQVDMGQRLVYDLRARLLAHLQALPLRHHVLGTAADSVYRLDADAHCVDDLASAASSR
jgi:hypothetical protein